MPALPFIPFADCAEVIINGLCGGSQVIFTNAVRKVSTLSDGDLPTIHLIFDDWWQNYCRGSIGDDFVVQTIKVTNLNTVSSGVWEQPPSANPSGAVSGTIAPNNAAQLVSFKTASRGRSYRGRNYLPAIPSANLLDASHITTAAVTALNDAYDQLALSIVAGGYTHVVLSRYNAGVRRTVGVATPITNYIAKSLIATQRRRILGVGS